MCSSGYPGSLNFHEILWLVCFILPTGKCFFFGALEPRHFLQITSLLHTPLVALLLLRFTPMRIQTRVSLFSLTCLIRAVRYCFDSCPCRLLSGATGGVGLLSLPTAFSLGQRKETLARLFAAKVNCVNALSAFVATKVTPSLCSFGYI